nr:transglycosylase SLT domain-containing protein [uncultured Rhodopila sp.]
MTTLTTAAVLSLVMQCAPGMDPKLLAGFAQQESGYDPLALHINQMPAGWLQPHANSVADAAQIAAQFVSNGHSVDLGMMQINTKNLGLLGLGLAEAFDPCRSIAAAGKLIALMSRYNTGDPAAGVRNGYAAAVVSRIHALKVADITPAPPAPPDRCPADDDDGWHTVARPPGCPDPTSTTETTHNDDK